ncbi:hypothetical protein N7481_001469 [Penicillium waksmanii]|uniref:uncharacterized protein n=1 Tax=Penicillium waksmanii TaxID=69791 RepID=UPI002549A2BC|nr:uncharacterized protein N7481_001469 [Penicillium waksmanii]KAJ6001060.1 hypothetical protein N7481_001469 [Penicillium waksmanii]
MCPPNSSAGPQSSFRPTHFLGYQNITLAFSVAPGQDTSSAVDALMESVLNDSGENTAPGNSNTFENNQIFAHNEALPNGQAPINYERDQLGADLPAAHQPYIPDPETATTPPIQTRIANGEVKRESSAPAIWRNDAGPGFVPLEHLFYGGPYEGENHKEMMHIFSEIGRKPETTDAIPAQPGTGTQPALPWTPIQSTPGRRVLASPPSPPALEFGTYRGKRWAECVHYINTMEAHFSRYPNYYTETRKVELGAKYISPALMDKWHDHIMSSENASWMSYCTFLAQQLSRYADHRQALMGIASASQKIAQPVTHFALWLIQWEPVAPDVSNSEFRAYLLRGVLPDIRARAQKSYMEFLDYNSFAMYLQEIENSTPSRAKFFAKRNNSTAPTDGLFVPMNTNEAARKHKEILPSDLPTEPRSQFIRQKSTEVPAPRDLGLYSARSWWECKTFMSKLQDYFDKCGNHCKEAQNRDRQGQSLACIAS